MSGLADLGYMPGKNLLIECRSAEQSYDGLLPAAEELVRLRVDVIVAMSHPAARAARLATDSVPIIMIASGDPVAAGLVHSLAKPGGPSDTRIARRGFDPVIGSSAVRGWKWSLGYNNGIYPQDEMLQGLRTPQPKM